ARRVGQIARRLAAGLSLENGWQYETAAILSALPRREPTEILPSLASMPRMETVAGIVERGDRPVAEEEMEAEGERALVVLGSLLVQEAQRLETRLDPDRSIEDGLRSLGESGESVPDALVRGLPDSDLRRAA
ncbi:MAG: hypothetical protein QUU85_08305, partial [Candidatus Eisenbacteria bacterium]|nr:hypothetical protein [Candidatus Eisenbacteria bacterium]